MGLRGPPPKPSVIRELEGNPGGLPVNRQEPKPQAVLSIDPPDHLDEEEKMLWRSIAPEMVRLGLLTVVDVVPFSRYIEALKQYRQAKRQLNGILMITLRNPDGTIKYVQQNPMLHTMNQASDRMLRLEQQFGMTPAARVRLMVQAQEAAGGEEDPYGA